MNCPHGANNTANLHWACDNCSSAASDFSTEWAVPDWIFWDTSTGKGSSFCFVPGYICTAADTLGNTQVQLKIILCVYCWRCGWVHLPCLRTSEYWQLWCPVRSLGLCRFAMCPSRQRFYSASCFRSEPVYWLLEVIWKRWTHQHQGRIKYYDSFLLIRLVSILKVDQNHLFGTRGTLPDCFIRKPFHSFCSSLIQNQDMM